MGRARGAFSESLTQSNTDSQTFEFAKIIYVTKI